MYLLVSCLSFSKKVPNALSRLDDSAKAFSHSAGTLVPASSLPGALKPVRFRHNVENKIK